MLKILVTTLIVSLFSYVIMESIIKHTENEDYKYKERRELNSNNLKNKIIEKDNFFKETDTIIKNNENNIILNIPINDATKEIIRLFSK